MIYNSEFHTPTMPDTDRAKRISALRRQLAEQAAHTDASARLVEKAVARMAEASGSGGFGRRHIRRWLAFGS